MVNNSQLGHLINKCRFSDVSVLMVGNRLSHFPSLPFVIPPCLFSLQHQYFLITRDRDKVLFRSLFFLHKDKRIQRKRKTILFLFLNYASLLPVLKRAVSYIGKEIQQKLNNPPRVPTVFAPILEFKPQQKATSKLPCYRVLKF